MERRVIVAGATGMVGRLVVERLAARGGVHVTALVRKPSGLARAGAVEERVVDFDDKATYAALACDALFCCLGSTMRAAGSREAFQRIERDLPLRLLAGAMAAGRPTFAFVSSAGAHRPMGFYLATKAEVERGIVASGLPYVIARPSLLLGDRQEHRPGERLAIGLAPPVFGAVEAVLGRSLALVGRYRPVAAARVADALVAAVLDAREAPRRVLEGYELDPPA